MYYNLGSSPDEREFNISITEMDEERNLTYYTKLDVANDIDNSTDKQHEACSEFGHTSDIELGLTEKIRSTKECYAYTMSKRTFYAISWEDINEAINSDKLVRSIRDKLIANDQKGVKELIKGKTIKNTDSKGSSQILIEDLSLYKNTLMVRNRIWAPDSLTRSFFNNLHLGHRGVDVMSQLSQRSVYWTNMTDDLESYLNECTVCNQLMQRNKTTEPLPIEEADYPYQKLTYDIGHTNQGEHFIAIADRFSGYIWTQKTGDAGTGTSAEIIEILKNKLGTGLFLVEKIKSDEGTQFMSHEIKEFFDQYGIVIDTSSAYNPHGNLLAENAIKRCKRAIAGSLYDEDEMDLAALNTFAPTKGNKLTPFEALHGMVSPIFGMPITEENKKMLLKRDWMTKYPKRGTIDSNTPLRCPDPGKCFTEDMDIHTRIERNRDTDWLEKIHKSPEHSLSSGDRVYFSMPNVKGYGKWKSGIIMERKEDYQYADGTRSSKGFTIFDLENCKTTTRTRRDIRKYKMSKVEKELMKECVKIANKLQIEFHKNPATSPPDHPKPSEIILGQHYTKDSWPANRAPDNEFHTIPDEIIPEEQTGNIEDSNVSQPLENTSQELPTTSAPENIATPPVFTTPKQKRMLSNLKSSLGEHWKCDDGNHLTTRTMRLRNRSERIAHLDVPPTLIPWFNCEI